MLQITTGKLFAQGTAIENALRGILYTNINLEYAEMSSISGPMYGSLKQSSELGISPNVLIYEFTERIQAPSGPVLSHGADSYVRDMAMLVSLVFDCTCSPDIDLVRRLISGQRGTATGLAPNAMVGRVFDKDAFLQPGGSTKFSAFVEHLLGLERKTYLGVMRAIRTYITGLHRIADDFELAYTLMVAAAESLTQDFDGYTSDWHAVSEEKRNPIDEALIGATDEIAVRVRNAIVQTEHVALGRRFKEFVAAYVSPEYFEGPFEAHSSPPGRSELPELLTSAYQARSKYVHQLQRLPDLVVMGYGHAETVLPIGTTQRMLTLQGLARLVRDVIMSFVHAQSTIEKEIYDYSLEIAGVKLARLGDSSWVANAEGDISEMGRVKLQTFTEQLAAAFMKVPDATVSDISKLLNKFNALAAGMRPVNRRPYFAMLLLFNRIAGDKWVRGTAALEKLLQADLKEPSPEALLVHAIYEDTGDWTTAEYETAFLAYKRRRSNKTGLRLPRLFEAAIGLALAERYRSEGAIDRFRQTAVLVVDDFPDHPTLRETVRGLSDHSPLNWKEILLPKPTSEPAAPMTSSPKFGKKPRNRCISTALDVARKKVRLRKNILSPKS